MTDDIQRLKKAVIYLSQELENAWYHIDLIRGHEETYQKTEGIREWVEGILGEDNNDD